MLCQSVTGFIITHTICNHCCEEKHFAFSYDSGTDQTCLWVELDFKQFSLSISLVTRKLRDNLPNVKWNLLNYYSVISQYEVHLGLLDLGYKNVHEMATRSRVSVVFGYHLIVGQFSTTQVWYVTINCYNKLVLGPLVRKYRPTV